jgi:hypothetical protein
VIFGTDFEDAFKASLVNDLAAQLAKDIGRTWGSGKNPAAQTLAHIGLGAATAELTGKDAASGAIGGLVESVLDNTIPESLTTDDKPTNRTLYTAGSALTAGLVADILGKDPATAAEAARNAAENNALSKKRVSDYNECKSKGGNCSQELSELARINKVTNDQLAASCENMGNPTCRDMINAALEFVSNPEAQKYLGEEVEKTKVALSKYTQQQLKDAAPKDFSWPSIDIAGFLAGDGLPSSGNWLDYLTGIGKSLGSAALDQTGVFASDFLYGAPVGMVGENNQYMAESPFAISTLEELRGSQVFSVATLLAPISGGKRPPTVVNGSRINWGAIADAEATGWTMNLKNGEWTYTGTGRAPVTLGGMSLSAEAQSFLQAANLPFKGQGLTNAGRATTKHPEYFGFSSTEELRAVYRTNEQLNALAAQRAQEILANGVRTTGASGWHPNGWVTYTLPDGRAASWSASGEFIGFRGVQK